MDEKRRKMVEDLIYLARNDREVYRHIRTQAWIVVEKQNNFVKSNKLN